MIRWDTRVDEDVLYRFDDASTNSPSHTLVEPALLLGLSTTYRRVTDRVHVTFRQKQQTKIEKKNNRPIAATLKSDTNKRLKTHAAIPILWHLSVHMALKELGKELSLSLSSSCLFFFSESAVNFDLDCHIQTSLVSFIPFDNFSKTSTQCLPTDADNFHTVSRTEMHEFSAYRAHL